MRPDCCDLRGARRLVWRHGAPADPTYSINGTITDASGGGVSGLSIVVADATNITVGAATTNPDGTYSVAGLAPGPYTLSIAGGNGYLPIQSAVTIVSDDVVLNLTDPRYATIAGTITVQSAPVSGIRLSAFDSVSGVEYDAISPTDANGAYSITFPAASPGYKFEFTNSAGARLAIASYVLGGNSVALSSPCVLVLAAPSQIDLSAGRSDCPRGGTQSGPRNVQPSDRIAFPAGTPQRLASRSNGNDAVTDPGSGRDGQPADASTATTTTTNDPQRRRGLFRQFLIRPHRTLAPCRSGVGCW